MIKIFYVIVENVAEALVCLFDNNYRMFFVKSLLQLDFI